jgi:hypothetical protein
MQAISKFSMENKSTKKTLKQSEFKKKDARN